MCITGAGHAKSSRRETSATNSVCGRQRKSEAIDVITVPDVRLCRDHGGSPLKALELIRSSEVDVVILDYELPYMNGMTLAQELRRAKPLVPIVLFSGHTDIPLEVLQSVDANVSKGEDLDLLLHKVRLLANKVELASHAAVVQGS